MASYFPLGSECKFLKSSAGICAPLPPEIQLDYSALGQNPRQAPLMKAVVLAGGSGSRLFPVTRAINKHLLPVYDTPLIYFPIRTLKELGASEILIVTNPDDLPAFKRLLGTGAELGVSLSYAAQERPAGIAHGILSAETWLSGSPFFLILGDNIYEPLGTVDLQENRAIAFLRQYQRADICRFDVYNPGTLRIEEKPAAPASDLVATGLYFLPGNAPRLCRSLKPSPRGELEIADLLNLYGDLKSLDVLTFDGKWMDCGTFESMWKAAAIQRVGCPLLSCMNF